ncbi:MAG: hypothetical protein OSB09_10030 [Planctomycetota bacterium]|nr:hypothetical protein [Planctomycetota bacterium]MDE0961107.1 hypothetical protein [Planctomycetota bacterium]
MNSRNRGWILLLMGMIGSCWPGAKVVALETTVVISPVAVVAPDGSICGQMAVVIQSDGTIAAVIPADQADPALTTVRAAPGSVLTPGLHDLFGQLGCGQNTLIAGTVLFDFELDAAAAFDPTLAELDQAATHGVLYSTIAAAPAGILNGSSATFLCLSGAEAYPMAAGRPVYALAESVLQSSREPTSRAAMISLWKEWIGDGVAKNKDPGILFCPDSIDFRQTLSLSWKSLPVLVHQGDARSPVERLAGRNALMVVGPFLEDGNPAAVETAIRAARTGTELAFRGGLPATPAHHLRGSAAIAVAAGLDGDAARRALFINPARVVGGDSIGIIEPGARADLVLFSTDPLDPAARVLHVWRGGQRLLKRTRGSIRELGGVR